MYSIEFTQDSYVVTAVIKSLGEKCLESWDHGLPDPVLHVRNEGN